MSNKIYINGEIRSGLYDKVSKRLYKIIDEGYSSVEVVINSVGGSVIEGMNIYDLLVSSNLEVITVAEKAYSIASIILCAGSIRISQSEIEKPFLLHLPRLEGKVGQYETSEQLRLKADYLEEIDEMLIDIYSEVLKDKTRAQIRQLLREDKAVTSETAKELGLITEIREPMMAVAYYNKEFNNNKEHTKTMKKTEKLAKAFTEFFSLFSNVVAEYRILTSDGFELVFPETDTEPVEGDVTTAPDGEYLMPNGDIWIIEGGKLKEILLASNPIEGEEEEVEIPTEPETEEGEEDEGEPGAIEEEAETLEEDLYDFIKVVSQRLDAMEERITALEDLETQAIKKIKKDIVAIRKEIKSDGNYTEKENRPKSWVNINPHKINK